MATHTVVKQAVIPSVKGHFFSNAGPVGNTAARHKTTGAAHQVSITLGSAQPNTDRRRYVTHR